MAVNFTVSVEFRESYFKKLGLNGQGYDEPIDLAVDHTLNDAENVIKREVPRPGHSRSRSKPPYIPTGNLQRSIHKNKPGKCKGELRSNVPYWVYVQYGTSKMPANPFVTRTVRKIKPKLAQYVMEELKRAGVLD